MSIEIINEISRKHFIRNLADICDDDIINICRFVTFTMMKSFSWLADLFILIAQKI